MNICIIGTGYVGLVAAACLAEMGNDVVCIDVNPDVIDQLKAGNVHIFEPGLEPLVTRNTAEGRLRFSTDLAEGMEDARLSSAAWGHLRRRMDPATSLM